MLIPMMRKQAKLFEPGGQLHNLITGNPRVYGEIRRRLERLEEAAAADESRAGDGAAFEDNLLSGDGEGDDEAEDEGDGEGRKQLKGLAWWVAAWMTLIRRSIVLMVVLVYAQVT